MGLPKNRTNNPNGRPKGSKNKSSEAIRKAVIDLLERNIEELQKDFKFLNHRDKLKVIIALLPYALPKLQATAYNIDSDSQEAIASAFERIFPEEIGLND